MIVLNDNLNAFADFFQDGSEVFYYLAVRHVNCSHSFIIAAWDYSEAKGLNDEQYREAAARRLLASIDEELVTEREARAIRANTFAKIRKVVSRSSRWSPSVASQ